MSKRSPQLVSKQNHEAKERLPLKTKIPQVAGRLALAAVCLIPVADLAASDAAVAKLYQYTQSEATFSSKAFDEGLVNGGVALAIAAQSVGLGLVISRNKRMQNTFGEFDEYLEEREKTMSRPRRWLSKTVNAPYSLLKKTGGAFDAVGNKLATKNSRVAKAVGNFVLDTGKVNTMGTSAVIMQETTEGNPPSIKRNVRLGSIIAGSWIGGAEAVKELYRQDIPVLRPTMAFVGSHLNSATSMDIFNPLETPVSSSVLISLAAGLAITGWRVAKFHEEQMQTAQLEPAITEDWSEPTFYYATS